MTTTLEQQAETIIANIIQMPEAQRTEAAQSACGDNLELLRRVISLLSAAPLAGGFMDATADGAAKTKTIGFVGEKPGMTIGHYKLLEQIGEGGFGVVFMAEQDQPIRRRVAIKVIKLGMDTREVVARFEAERQALAMMDHPNIAKVFDAGSTDTGRPYFVMELVRGSTVTEYADKHKLSTRDRAALVAQICRAVQHAHSKGVIHRDIKPSNVLVTVTDDQPVPKVIDFGIAKATQSKLTDRTLFTAHRQLIGTPQYMSPEQADSDGSDIDTRTDVYSLGVLLYELLVGATPFDAKALRSAAYEAMRKMIRDTDVPRPATRLITMAPDTRSSIAASRSTDVKRLTDSVQGELDWIVMKALEKDRSRRYDTAAAFADDLNRYLAGDAVLAGPVSGMYRLQKTFKRYKAAAIVGSVIAACLLLGVAGTSWQLIRAIHAERRANDQTRAVEIEKSDALAQKAEADRQKQIAITAEHDAKTKAQEAKATLDFFTEDVLAKASPNNTKDASVSKVLVDALITPAMKTIDQRFADQPLVRASIQYTLAKTLFDLGRYDLAESPAKAAWDARRAALGEDHPDTLDALHYYAQVVSFLGRYADAEGLERREWNAQKRVRGDDDPITLSALNDYAAAVEAQGRDAAAEQLFKQALEVSRHRSGNDSPETLKVLGNYAAAIQAQGRSADAEPLLKQVWDGMSQAVGADHPDTLVALDAYAGAIRARGDHREAARLDKQCWLARQHVLGEDHPDTLTSLNDYALDVDEQGDHAAANPLLLNTWYAFRRVEGEEHPSTLIAKGNYALCLAAQSNYADSVPLLKQVWEVSGRVRGNDHPETAQALNNYMAAMFNGGYFVDAEPFFRKQLERLRISPTANELTVARNEYALGACLAHMGPAHTTEAKSLLQDAVATCSTKAGPHARPTTMSAGALADLLDTEHRSGDAAKVRAEAGLTPATSQSIR